MTNILVYVTTEDGTTINTTENHPFYVEGKGWCAAEELEAGDVCRTKVGQTEVVASVVIEHQEEPVKVYNLTIEDNHTYYVSVNEVLVHNNNGECGSNTNSNNRLALGLNDYLDDFARKNNAHTWKDFPDPNN